MGEERRRITKMLSEQDCVLTIPVFKGHPGLLNLLVARGLDTEVVVKPINGRGEAWLIIHPESGEYLGTIISTVYDEIHTCRGKETCVKCDT